MKIALITITYNDDYKFREWVELYQNYKDELYLHIIVDNSSTPEYLKQVEIAFPNSVIIKRQSNGGCTIAYNDAIRYALANINVDAIMLMGNDIRIEKGALSKLYSILYEQKQYGMISPLILQKDSNIIESFGCQISNRLYLIEKEVGKTVAEIPNEHTHVKQVEALAGGLNLSKREFYERVGLQDEKLFMYSDEVDMGLRAKETGLKMVVTAEVKSWHQHINPQQRAIRLPYSSYLIGRNKVYLTRKHKGNLQAYVQFAHNFYLFLQGFLSNINNSQKRQDRIWFLWGSYMGLIGNMKLKHIIGDAE